MIKPLRLGVAKIDEDHRQILETVEEVRRISISGETSRLLRVMEDLEDYTLNHFRKEEVLMDLFKYPRIEEHRHSHNEFLLEWDTVWKQMREPDPDLVRRFLQFLESWFTYHICTIDLDYARWISEHIHPATEIREDPPLQEDPPPAFAGTVEVS